MNEEQYEWTLTEEKANPNQPRVPAGSPQGGQFASTGGGGGAGATAPSSGGTTGVVSYETHRNLYKPDYKVEDGFYRPNQPIKVWMRSKETRPTNYWVGASRIHQPNFTEYTTKPGDTIIKWPGGNFVVRKGNTNRESIVFARSDKSPFERSYGPGPDRYIPVGAMDYIGRNAPTPGLGSWE